MNFESLISMNLNFGFSETMNLNFHKQFLVNPITSNLKPNNGLASFTLKNIRASTKLYGTFFSNL